LSREGLNVDEDTVLMSVLEAVGEEMKRQMKFFEDLFTDPFQNSQKYVNFRE